MVRSRFGGLITCFAGVCLASLGLFSLASLSLLSLASFSLVGIGFTIVCRLLCCCLLACTRVFILLYGLYHTNEVTILIQDFSIVTDRPASKLVSLTLN